MSYCSVLPAAPVDEAFTYRGEAVPGQFVRIPFGRRVVGGLVVAADTGRPDIAPGKIKDIEMPDCLSRLPGADYGRFIERMAAWTLIPKGQVLRLGLPSDALMQRPTRQTKASQPPATDFTFKQVALNGEQAEAAAAINTADGFQTFLLHGVTGSGKTEVFFDAIEKTIQAGKQVLVMMPEIALTNSFISRFEDRFGVAPGLWHSGQTPARRRGLWQGVLSGQTKLVLGARSALFLPFQNLGLIVVDEEHDGSYKQEEGAIYHARDMAVLRAQTHACPVVLASATPSLETLHNARAGRYTHLELPNRYGQAGLPDVSLIDMRSEAPETGRFLSPKLVQDVTETVAKGQQAMLFLNRRGYAPLTLCRACGNRLECPQCTAWLVAHKQSGRTFCHHCGYGGRSPDECPSCGAADALIPIGPGVERVAEELESLFPDARIAILSSDMETEETLGQIHDGDIDIIIGTQMIAKGHHFPNLTYVGVVDADLGMDGGDFRSGERTWQLLHQVAGRAGRGDEPGHVSLQTYQAGSQFMQSLAEQDHTHFVEQELQVRQLAGMPPFARLAGIILSDTDQGKVEQAAAVMAKAMPHYKGVEILGPAVPVMAMLRGRHRRRFLVTAEKGVAIQKIVAEWVAATALPQSVKCQIDIDPISFF